MKQLDLTLEILKQNRRKLINNVGYLIGDKRGNYKDHPYILLDEVSHGNLGDQAIAYAEHQFVKKYSGVDMFSFLDFESIGKLRSLKTGIDNKNSILFFHGGGNFGTLYPSAESLRRTVINKFPDTKIIMFPQSIFFSNDVKGKYELKISSKIYSNKQNFIIFSREPKSYEIIKNNFNNDTFLVIINQFSKDEFFSWCT